MAKHDDDDNELTLEEVVDGQGPSFGGKTVVVCLGNPYMKDDGVALAAAKRLRQRHLGGNALVFERQSIDLALLWQFRDAKKVIVVDAIESGDVPGTISRYSIVPREGPLLELPNLHGLELHDAFDIGQANILSCPVTIIGVQPKDRGAGEGLSEELINALPRVVTVVMEELGLPDE